MESYNEFESLDFEDEMRERIKPLPTLKPDPEAERLECEELDREMKAQDNSYKEYIRRSKNSDSMLSRTVFSAGWNFALRWKEFGE